MADELTIAEAGVVSGLGTDVGTYAEEVRGVTTTPGFAACSGQSGSKVSAACKGQDGNVKASVDTVAGRLEQFADVCQDAEAAYGNTEDGIASGFKSMGDA